MVSQLKADGLSHPNYRPDIDGLRAVAVLSVVGFHAFPSRIVGGFIGVDVFFVISGFLISGIIFRNLESSSFSYAEFYFRRIKRIFPALITVLIFTLLFGWFVLLADEFSQLGKHVASGIGFISNFSFWQEAGYFDSSAATKPLLHLWSLGIEEQFYIFWPPLLGLMWRRHIGFLGVLLAVAAASFAINLWTVDNNPVAAFYSPLSRFWELMVGGILAYITLHRSEYLLRWKNCRAFLGFALLLCGFLLVSERSHFPGWWALLPAIGTFLVISAGPSAWLNRYFLANNVFVWFGLISFPLYLWHWPLLSYVHILYGELPPSKIRVVAIMAAVLLAWLTYIGLEKKIRVKRGGLPALILLSVAASLLVSGLLGWGHAVNPRNSGSDLSPILQAMGDWSYPPNNFDEFRFDGQLFYRKNAAPEQVVFFGDSHIEQYYPRISDVLRGGSPSNRTVILATHGGCPPVPGVFDDKHSDCDGFRRSTIKMLQNESVDSVVIGGCWNCYFIEEATEKSAEEMIYNYYYLDNGKPQYFRKGNGVELALAALRRFLTELGQHKKVYLLLDNPSGKGFDPKNYFEGSRLTHLRRSSSEGLFVPLDPEQSALRDRLISIASQAHVEIIDPTAHICQHNECAALMPDGMPIYKDASHIRPFYVRANASFIDVAISK
jgi:peptidoglycan/LPS O-acetylase OafA/YrhL